MKQSKLTEYIMGTVIVILGGFLFDAVGDLSELKTEVQELRAEKNVLFNDFQQLIIAKLSDIKADRARIRGERDKFEERTFYLEQELEKCRSK